jgi:hypothetical protein
MKGVFGQEALKGAPLRQQSLAHREFSAYRLST